METEKIDVIELGKKIKQQLDEFKNAKVKCAIIGRSGTGKSSLINAISGEYMAEVGETETTIEISKPIEYKGLIFQDLPGSSTKNFPLETYVDKFNLKSFDCVILVTSDRFLDDDSELIKNILKVGVPIFLVRSKVDFSVERGLKRGISESETLKILRDDLLKNIDTNNTKGVYLVSADYPAKYDLSNLLSDISNNLDDIKRQRFIANISITSQDILDKKRELCKSLILKYSTAAALNGINPILGVDVAIDLILLYEMAKDIQEIYGLNEAQTKYHADLLDQNKKTILLKQAMQFGVKYLGKEAIMILLKQLGKKFAVKEISKYIPFVGQAVAAMVGFQMCNSIGNDMLDDAEKIATDAFNAMKSL